MSAKKKRTKSERIPVASGNKPSVVKTPQRERRTIDAGRLRLLCQSTLFGFCFLFSICFNPDFFNLVGELAFFQDTWAYFLDRAGVVGGSFRYVSDLLTSFFLYPAVGSFLLALLLLFVQMAVARLFRLTGSLVPLSTLPSLLLYSAITKTGFLIFADIHVCLLFANVLGTLAALLFALGYRRIPSPRWRLLYGVLGVYALYFAAGFFGILAMLLCLAAEFGFPDTHRRTLRVESMLFLGVLAPPLFFRLGLSHTEFVRIFFILLPEISGQVFTYYTFYFALSYLGLFFLAILWLIRDGKFRAEAAKSEVPAMPSSRRVPLVFSFLASIPLLFSMIETVCHAYIWKDLPVVFRLSRLMEQGDWEKMLRVPDGHPAPLRPIVLMRNLALFKTGRLGNEAFTRSQYSRRHALMEIVTSTNICGQRILYEYGYVNPAYRFSLNHLIMRGENIFDLKMLARCALANGETALARKYLYLIGRSPFHRRWAGLRLRWLDGDSADRPRPDDDVCFIAEEIDRIRALIPKDDSFLSEQHSLDRYILDLFLVRDFETSPAEVREMTLFLFLQQKQVERFVADFERCYPESGDRVVPVHFQEGLLAASLAPEKTLEDARISPDVRKRYHELVEFVKQNGNLHLSSPIQYAKLLEKRFGRTYWYFYLGVGGLNAY